MIARADSEHPFANYTDIFTFQTVGKSRVFKLGPFGIIDKPYTCIIYSNSCKDNSC